MLIANSAMLWPLSLSLELIFNITLSLQTTLDPFIYTRQA
jgi:hypothetical protein